MGATADQRGDMYQSIEEFLDDRDGDPSEVLDAMATILEGWEDPNEEEEETVAAERIRNLQHDLEDDGL